MSYMPHDVFAAAATVFTGADINVNSGVGMY